MIKKHNYIKHYTFKPLLLAFCFLLGAVPFIDGSTYAQDITGAGLTTLILCPNGTVEQSGNIFANDSMYVQPTPVPVKGLTDIIAIASGDLHSLALKKDGTVWVWGYNFDGELGLGDTINRYAPVQVSGLTDVVAIAAGYYYSSAIKKDGSLWVWGYNPNFELGLGDKTNKYVPEQQNMLTDVAAVAWGSVHSIALKKDGTLWAWGNNNFGQLGDSTQMMRKKPVQVQKITDVIAIDVGLFHSIALTKDGNLWTWGGNLYGELCDSILPYTQWIPARIKGLIGIQSIACGDVHTLVAKKDGSVWACGANSEGQLGIDSIYKAQHSPIQVKGIKNVVKVASGLRNSYAMLQDGSIWGWGNNQGGQLGDGTKINRKKPVLVQSQCVTNGIPAQQISRESMLFYPNPVSETATLTYSVPQNTLNAFLNVYDMKGALIHTYPLNLKDNNLSISANDYKNGVYLYGIEANGFSTPKKKMVIIK